MTILNLSRRLTRDYKEYEKHLKSSENLIYVDQDIKLEDSSASFDLTVGEGWFDSRDNRHYVISEHGVTLQPSESIVLETRETVGVPLNAFGVVTGKGVLIFKGIMVSSGKIDPGFCNRLRVGLYNGGRERVTLLKGAPLSTCFFFNIDTGFEILKQREQLEPSRIEPNIPRRLQVFNFLKQNWVSVVSIVIAVVALIKG